MAQYCVTYDIRGNDPEDYRHLIDHLKSYPSWWHHLESTWLIKSEDTAKEVLRKCLRYVPHHMEILVIEVGTTWAGAGFEDEGCYNWLWKNLSSRVEKP
ncbi:MAG: hypothetical protein C7B47_06345 [Sulfobacillus thermosulfidooxidans]|uniref:SinR family protein n=1 Tax=Sulfobacillus thermosulfidooxidans TaxID=28034 RepID=A0A2T2X0S5_SULTH|nr:MAG: hypothetical protein C7B47_06345 [Sulfobacillus thermosulfidooxidans]